MADAGLRIIVPAEKIIRAELAAAMDWGRAMLHHFLSLLVHVLAAPLRMQAQLRDSCGALGRWRSAVFEAADVGFGPEADMVFWRQTHIALLPPSTPLNRESSCAKRPSRQNDCAHVASLIS